MIEVLQKLAFARLEGGLKESHNGFVGDTTCPDSKFSLKGKAKEKCKTLAKK
jgi:hypothetical protein